MKLGKWTIVVPDKIIIKQYSEEGSKGYVIEDNNFWNNNLSSKVHAIQYTGNNNDFEQVEHNDGTPHASFTGDIKIFADAWDAEHLKKLQKSWDNNFIYESVANNNITPENPLPFKRVKIEETIEQKTSRIGIRPSNYISENIY